MTVGKIIVAICIIIVHLIAIPAYGKDVESPPIDYMYEKYNPILISIGASPDEANMLITLAVAEMAGQLDVVKACAKWGCDNGTSFSVWQIQCINKPGKSWSANRWLWYLREKLNEPNLQCEDIHGDIIAAKSALVIMRTFGMRASPIETMLMWGKSQNPQRRVLLLNSIYNKVKKRRAA
jgi:hypothetical protein